MGKITKLSAEVIDQISAGEVVERPSHMVKELIENAVDAGATEIEVEFNEGGRFVRVKDNGQGIEKADLALALDRHATSKIKKSDDLWGLKSFGFRGEALASISAVSHLKIISRRPKVKTASQLTSQFGKKSEVVDVGGEPGTTIFVERLFENVPARLKFLKSDGAEGTQIKNVFKAMAMAHPEVSFRLRSKGKLLYYFAPASSRKQRVEDVLDIEPMYAGKGECQGIHADVVVSPPNKTNKTSRQIWIFVQNRWVQDRSLQAALLDGYRSLLMHGEFPFAAIWVDCPLDEIDVNIHPTKSQVKFEKASDAFRAVHRATRTIMEESPWVQELVQKPTSENSERQSLPTMPAEAFSSIRPAQQSPQEGLRFDSPEFETTQYKKKTLPEFKIDSSAKANHLQSNAKAYESSVKVESTKATLEPTQKGFWSSLQVLGQSQLTYIICQSRTALVFVDQHAAHERVAYERLMKAWKEGGIDVQNYLLPLTIDLEEEQVEAIVKEWSGLESLGISIDQQGPTSIAIRSAPSLVNEKSLAAMFNLLGRELVEKSGSFAIEKKISDICATLACHSVVRAGQSLSPEEMSSLLEQMDEFSMSSFCPHGRPVYVEYPFQKLERDFGRIV